MESMLIGVDSSKMKINKQSLEETIETWRHCWLNVAFQSVDGVITPRKIKRPTRGKICPDPLAKVVALVKGTEEEQKGQNRRITQAVTNIDQVKLVEIFLLDDDDEERLNCTIAAIAAGIEEGNYDILVAASESVLSGTIETILDQPVPAAVYFLEEGYGIITDGGTL